MITKGLRTNKLLTKGLGGTRPPIMYTFLRDYLFPVYSREEVEDFLRTAIIIVFRIEE